MTSESPIKFIAVPLMPHHVPQLIENSLTWEASAFMLLGKLWNRFIYESFFYVDSGLCCGFDPQTHKSTLQLLILPLLKALSPSAK
jgi:hypothetical protein